MTNAPVISPEIVAAGSLHPDTPVVLAAQVPVVAPKGQDIFSSMWGGISAAGSWVGNAVGTAGTWVGNNAVALINTPIVSAAWHSVIGCAVGYVAQNGFNFTGSPWGAIGVAAAGGIYGYLTGKPAPTDAHVKQQISDALDNAITKRLNQMAPGAAAAISPEIK